MVATGVRKGARVEREVVVRVRVSLQVLGDGVHRVLQPLGVVGEGQGEGGLREGVIGVNARTLFQTMSQKKPRMPPPMSHCSLTPIQK